jgi:hypothetical protein
MQGPFFVLQIQILIHQLLQLAKAYMQQRSTDFLHIHTNSLHKSEHCHFALLHILNSHLLLSRLFRPESLHSNYLLHTSSKLCLHYHRLFLDNLHQHYSSNNHNHQDYYSQMMHLYLNNH